jgi:hypothetical protein
MADGMGESSVLECGDRVTGQDLNREAAEQPAVDRMEPVAETVSSETSYHA